MTKDYYVYGLGQRSL